MALVELIPFTPTRLPRRDGLPSCQATKANHHLHRETVMSPLLLEIPFMCMEVLTEPRECPTFGDLTFRA